MSSPESSLKVAILPMTSGEKPQENIESIFYSMDRLDPDVDLLCLPENSLFLNLDSKPIPRSAAFDFNSPEIQSLARKAKEKRIAIHLGGIPWLMDGEVFNEALFIDQQGKIHETFEKLHLFDVDLGPGIQVSESSSYKAGHRLGVFEIKGWKLATCICYDLRFPELFHIYRQEFDVDAFVVPAAFTTKTGAIHWKPLLQARAIECQSYVLAAAQVGYHRSQEPKKLRKSWGQSLAFSPWGKCLGETSSYQEFLDSHGVRHEPIVVVMDKEEIHSYRKSIPVMQHRSFHMEYSLK